MSEAEHLQGCLIHKLSYSEYERTFYTFKFKSLPLCDTGYKSQFIAVHGDYDELHFQLR